MSRNRIGGSGSQSRAKSTSPTKVTDVRQLLEEKRQGLSQHRQPPPAAASGKTGLLFNRLTCCCEKIQKLKSPEPGPTDPADSVCRCAAAAGEKAALPLPRLPQRHASSQRTNQRRASQTGRGQSRQPKPLLQFIQRQKDKYGGNTCTRFLFSFSSSRC